MHSDIFKIVLNSPLNLDIDKIKGQSTYKNITFEEFEILDLTYLMSQLETKLKFKTPPIFINLTEISPPGTYPHIDKFPTALNYYVNVADGDKTYFWETPPDLKYKDGMSNRCNVINKPNKMLSAKHGDFILINAHNIHSVDVSSKRTIIRLCWDIPSFKTVLDNIILV